MFRFITNKPLWVNILIGVLLSFGLLIGTIMSLGWFTKHNDAKTVPSVLGKTLAEAKKILNDAGFTVEIQDSVYYDSIPSMQVLRQIPDELEVVKSNRTVYLTYNRATPPLVEMPNILGYSFRNALMVLENAGLKLGDTTFRPDFAINSVLEQLYNGAPIQPGAKIQQGSKIDLVIASVLNNHTVAVPDVIGLTYAEAKAIIEGQGIILASKIFDPDVKDSASAYVYRQNPEKFDDEGHLRTIKAGQVMDLWLSSKPLTDSTRAKTQRPGQMPETDTADNE